MKKQKHNFTWNGKEITGCLLCEILDTSRTTLYNAAMECKSDVGEEIASQIKSSEQCYKIEFDGDLCTKQEIADLTGISSQTLKYREDTYGLDCCLTYFPGRIPIHLLPSRGPRKAKKITVGNGRGGNDLWKSMGGTKRDDNLAKIRVGTFERTMPCPPAGTDNANCYT